jgi:hypothetical protein
MKFTDPFGIDDLRCRIYTVEDTGTVIYVGLAKDSSVGERIAKHMENSISSKKRSAFARLLRSSHPTYLSWQVSVRTISECAALVGRELPSLEAAEQATYDFYKSKLGTHPKGNASRPSGKPRKHRRAAA